jgi:hypothetical protein
VTIYGVKNIFVNSDTGLALLAFVAAFSIVSEIKAEKLLRTSTVLFCASC